MFRDRGLWAFVKSFYCRLGEFLPGPFGNKATDEYREESEPEQVPVERDDREHVQRAYDREEWKEDSVYSAMNSPAGSSVDQAACSRPRDSHHPKYSPSSKRSQIHRKLCPLLLREQRARPEQIALRSPLEVSPTRRL